MADDSKYSPKNSPRIGPDVPIPAPPVFNPFYAGPLPTAPTNTGQYRQSDGRGNVPQTSIPPLTPLYLQPTNSVNTTKVVAQQIIENITNGSVPLPSTGNSAIKPDATDRIQFVSPNGNDTNDGLSWGTAKATVSAAITAIGSGLGRIEESPALGSDGIAATGSATGLNGLIIAPTKIYLGPLAQATSTTTGVDSCKLHLVGSVWNGSIAVDDFWDIYVNSFSGAFSSGSNLIISHSSVEGGSGRVFAETDVVIANPRDATPSLNSNSFAFDNQGSYYDGGAQAMLWEMANTINQDGGSLATTIFRQNFVPIFESSATGAQAEFALGGSGTLGVSGNYSGPPKWLFTNLRGSSFNVVSLEHSATANRTITFPDATGTLFLLQGTAGQIQFNNGADSNLFWDNTNKRLGVGTSSPGVPLEIKSTATGGAMQLLINNAATGGTTWYLGSTDNGNGIGGGFFTVNNSTTTSTAILALDANAAYVKQLRLDSSNKDCFITRSAAATIQLGDVNSATPVAQTLKVQGSRGGTDTNVSGANLTVQSGTGTGNAAASSISFQTPTVGSTGTTAQTQTTRLTIHSTDVTLASGVNLILSGATSGTTTVQATAAASGTLTLPAATDTLIGKATTDTLTNKTFDTAGTGNVLKIGGGTVPSSKGSANQVLAMDGTGTNLTFATVSSGSSPPFSDATALVKNSSDSTKTVTITTSGNTTGINGTLAAAFTTAKTLTLPDATDTLVARATTDTLSNKTLAGTTPFNRLRANQGTPLATSDFTITGLGLGSWGSTASVSACSGTDTCGSVTVTASGTGFGANPGIKLTFKDGAFANTPAPVVMRGDGNSPAVAAAIFNLGTTFITFGLGSAAPVAATYTFYWHVLGT